MYQLAIIGGGPGGVAAGIYAARKKIKTVFITDTFGGQSVVSSDIQNWVGTKSLSGFDLAKNLEGHLRAQSDIDIVASDKVVRVTARPDGGFALATEQGKMFDAERLLVASGSRRRKLGVPGEAELDGRGVAYCSTCDAPLFKGKRVAVVGGGNAGLEAVVDLLPYAAEIYLLERAETLKGDAVTQEKIRSDQKVKTLLGVETVRILGEKLVTGLAYRERASGNEKELPLEGVFIEIGALPNSDFVKDLVTLDAFNQIVADPRTQATSHPKIWAIGDVSDVLYKQNNISAGDAVKAVLNIYEDIHKG